MRHSFGFKIVATLSAALVTLSLGACGRGDTSHQAPQSSIETVEIPVTKVKDQRRVGFCWSYALVALVESQYLLKTDKVVNVSEEALGFYRMAEHLHYLSRTYQGAELDSMVDQEVLDGYWAIYPENPYLDAMRLVKKYGLVPDAVWNYKFGGPADVNGDQKIADIRAAMKKLVKGRAKGKTTIEEVMSRALVASGGYPSKPPTTFPWQGANVTAKDWALKTLGFDPDAYAMISGYSADDFARMVAALKRSLARGVPALMSFDVYDGLVDLGDLKGTGVPLSDDRYTTSTRHMVLVTDFVNAGARPGGMQKSQIEAEVAKASSQLDYIVFKNSYGYTSWSSSSRRMVEPGMYTMDKGYIQGNLHHGIWELVVPKDLVANPEAPYAVNTRVTGTDELGDRELARTPFFTVTATDLNCRQQPGSDNAVLTRLFTGDVVWAQGLAKDPLGQQWVKVVTGSRDDASETTCFVRGLKSYLNTRRLGEIACPTGFKLHSIGRDGGRYCMQDGERVLGPFPQDMIDKCIAWGGGDSTCRTAETWGRKLALSARGYDTCPLGTWYDFDVDYCTDGLNVFGPFPEYLVQRCIDFTKDRVVCRSARWSQRVLFFLQRSEN
jgi:hypothetical protein